VAEDEFKFDLEKVLADIAAAGGFQKWKRGIQDREHEAAKMQKANVAFRRWMNAWKLDILTACAARLFGEPFATRLKADLARRVENVDEFGDGYFAGFLGDLLKVAKPDPPKFPE
jgi:hypothetical protein